MKRKSLGLLAAVAAASGLAAPAVAQSVGLSPAGPGLLVSFAAQPEEAAAKNHEEKALNVIDTYVEKIGGEELINSIESMQTSGKISIPMAGIEGTMNMYVAKPGKMAMVMELPGFGKTETGFDGEYGWSSDPMQGPRLMTDEEVADINQQADPNAQAKHRELYDVIAYAGEVDFKGQKAHKIRLERAEDGQESFEYYSVDTGLLIGQEAVQASPMGEIKMVTELSEYKEFDGMKVPTKMTQNIGPQQIIITISSVAINKVDPSVFARPAAVEALVEARKDG